MSSIKKKVSSRNAVKTKKPAKSSKPAPKKPAAKKPAPKKAPVKANVKKKAAPAKKPVAKKVISKTAAKKPPVKKVVAKSKNAPKKAVKAPVKANPIVNKADKKAIVKNASPAKKPAAKKAPEVKKAQSKKPEVKAAKATPPKEMPKPAEKKEVVNEKPKSPVDVFSKKPAQKSATDVLAISNTIPVKQKHEISASKIALISNSITNPVKKTDSYAIKPEKEPAGKFEMEFVFHASAEMLYEFLSTPSGLSEWFCDDLNIRNGIYTFIWDDQLQQARLLKTVELQVVRFQWVDKTDGSYFEFRIQRDDLTNDISLIITDFADSVGDRESSKLLWNSQVEKLMHVMGSIF